MFCLNSYYQLPRHLWRGYLIQDLWALAQLVPIYISGSLYKFPDNRDFNFIHLSTASR